MSGEIYGSVAALAEALKNPVSSGQNTFIFYFHALLLGSGMHLMHTLITHLKNFCKYFFKKFLRSANFTSGNDFIIISVPLTRILCQSRGRDVTE